MRNISIFNPTSPQAQVIADLFFAVLAICGVILAVVTVLVVASLLRSRRLPDTEEPPQIFGHKHLEILWTVIPCLILVWIFALTVRAMRITDPAESVKPDVTVIGHQWWWEVRYGDSAAWTANEIHIPVEKKLAVQLEAADVIHDFWAPQLGRKKDMVPGMTNYIWLQADKEGTYLGACAEYCGSQHAWMRFFVMAESPGKFAAWLENQARPARSGSGGEPGRQWFEQMTCANCHPLRGVATRANAGPDLTHLASRRTLAGGVLQNTPAELARWLANPQIIKPSCKMPNLHLSTNQVDEMVNYFKELQ